MPSDTSYHLSQQSKAFAFSAGKHKGVMLSIIKNVSQTHQDQDIKVSASPSKRHAPADNTVCEKQYEQYSCMKWAEAIFTTERIACNNHLKGEFGGSSLYYIRC